MDVVAAIRCDFEVRGYAGIKSQARDQLSLHRDSSPIKRAFHPCHDHNPLYNPRQKLHLPRRSSSTASLNIYIEMPPPPRRARGSTPTPAGLEDISTLTLGEVRSRLERNERVLSTALFTGTTSPASPVLSSSPTSEAQPFAVGSPTSDPFREKLLAARQHLLAREHELVSQDGMQNMDMGNGDQQLAESSSDARRRSSAASFGAVMRSGKARAVETIQAGEGKLAQNGIIL